MTQYRISSMREAPENRDVRCVIKRMKSRKKVSGSRMMAQMVVIRLHKEPPDAERHVRWCGRGGRKTPLPDLVVFVSRCVMSIGSGTIVRVERDVLVAEIGGLEGEGSRAVPE